MLQVLHINCGEIQQTSKRRMGVNPVLGTDHNTTNKVNNGGAMTTGQNSISSACVSIKLIFLSTTYYILNFTEKWQIMLHYNHRLEPRS